MLKDELRGRYFRLTPRGLFVWELLDGAHTVRDILQDYHQHYGEDGAGLVAALLARLEYHGFVGHAAPGSRQGAPIRRTAGGPAATAHRLLTAQATLTNVDPLLTLLYRRLGRYSYTWPAQMLWLLLALGGGWVFLSLAYGGRMHLVTGSTGGWLIPLILVLGWLIHVPIHELQHGLTVKHFGREVRRMGVGWFWFAPMCWIDTSDIWLERRWRRIATSFAGPYSNLVMGGVLSLVMRALPDGAARTGLFGVALMLYVGFLSAFNLLLEYDGYYMLVDFLETNHPRQRAIGFLARDLAPQCRAGRFTRAAAGALLYAVGGLAYVIFMGAQIVLIYRARLAHLAGAYLPQPVAASLGWGLAGLFLLVVSLGVLHEIAMARSSPVSSRFAPSATRMRPTDNGGEALEPRISK